MAVASASAKRVRSRATVVAPVPALLDPTVSRKPFAFSLFWRTFFLLALLLTGGVFAWIQTVRALEFEPRSVQAESTSCEAPRAVHADGTRRHAEARSILGACGPP